MHDIIDYLWHRAKFHVQQDQPTYMLQTEYDALIRRLNELPMYRKVKSIDKFMGHKIVIVENIEL